MTIWPLREYFDARWSLFEIEILSHHFCSRAPFARADAPGYMPVVAKLRSLGLMRKADFSVTGKGARFITALCNTPLPGEDDDPTPTIQRKGEAA